MEEQVKKNYGNKIRVRVSGIYINGNQILLVKHTGLGAKNGFWAPPGGGVEFQEGAQTALKREFLEETGLHVEVERLLCVSEHINHPLHAVELFFLVNLKSGELKKGFDPEHDTRNQLIEEVKFVTFKDLQIMPNENLHRILHDVSDQASILNMRGNFIFSA